jgi:hypothetical protein
MVKDSGKFSGHGSILGRLFSLILEKRIYLTTAIQTMVIPT